MTAQNIFSIEVVNPRDLGPNDFERIHQVGQDMWASEEGLGEFVSCTECGKVHSKEDIFGHLPLEIFQQTVASLIAQTGMNNIDCHFCGGDTRLIYGPENIAFIKERYLESVQCTLALARNGAGEIVGYEEGYADTIENIFRRDLYHYKFFGVEDVKRRVSAVLGQEPEHIFLFSGIGFLAPYRNPINLFQMFKVFSFALPEMLSGMIGMAELDKEGVIHKISTATKAVISLGYPEVENEKCVYFDKSPKYKNDLVLYTSPLETRRNHYTRGPRHVLSLLKGANRSIPRLSTPQREEAGELEYS